MRISSKGRLALAACVILAETYGTKENLSVLSISNELDSSKIYMEQVFTLLKKGKIVQSIKGAGGGYRLTRDAENIKVYDILKPIESALFEESKKQLGDKKEVSSKEFNIIQAIDELVFQKIDEQLKEVLSTVNLKEIEELYKTKEGRGYMFYI